MSQGGYSDRFRVREELEGVCETCGAAILTGDYCSEECRVKRDIQRLVEHKAEFSGHSIGVKIIDTPACEITVKADICDRCGIEMRLRNDQCDKHRLVRLEQAVDLCWETSIVIAESSRSHLGKMSLLHQNVMNLHLFKKAMDE